MPNCHWQNSTRSQRSPQWKWWNLLFIVPDTASWRISTRSKTPIGNRTGRVHSCFSLGKFFNRWNSRFSTIGLNCSPLTTPVIWISSVNPWSWSSLSLSLNDFRLVYLRAKPETCLERIRTRNRPAEQSITLEYLQQLHQRHEQWLSSTNTAVLTVDANQTEEGVYRDTNWHLINLVSC